MKTLLIVLTITFSSTASLIYSQTVTNKHKEFPAELKGQWYYQFIEELKLTPKDFSEFENFFINGTLVSENESGKVYTQGVAILNNAKIANNKTGEFEVYYFSVFKAKTDYDIFFDRVEFWEVDQNEIMIVTKTVNATEGHYYTQYYQSDHDVLCTEELYITPKYKEMLKAFNIE